MYKKMGNGFLQRSDFYEKGGNKPEYFGKISIGPEGSDPFVAELGAWIKEKNGKKYFSIAVTVREEDVSEPATEASTETEEDVPF